MADSLALNDIKEEEEEQESTLKESNLLMQLDLQLETLDDEEFHLPPVSELPTLDSILNEDDDDLGSVSDSEINPNTSLKPNFTGENCETASVLSKESSDSRSRTSFDQRHSHFRKETRSKSTGSVLRQISLKGLASQLINAHERVGAGLPTTMAVSKLICVGTSHGLILVFEPSQALKWCLGSTQQGEQHGSVSALAINQECTKLLAGFAKGHLCLFDLSNSKLLQNIPDAHTPFTAVLHIKWTDCPGLALICDSGGSVFELSIRRTMGMNSNETRCIFSGSRGEVCTIEPLIMGHFLTLPPVIDTLIVAMATISKVIVVSLRPHLKVLFSYPLKGSSATLPLLAWQFVIIQMPDGAKVIDPVLAFGREYDIYFYQLTHSSQEQLTFIPLQRMKVSYTLQALSWLNSRTLAIIDINETLHVIDVKSQEELDKVDLAKLGLVYASSHFKAIATGGNVSKAMEVGGDRACYHSMVTYGTQILLLGTKSFQVVTMRTWLERVDYLIKNNAIKEALYWLLDILEDKAQTVIGLTHKKQKRYEQVKEKLQNVLDLFLQRALSDRPERGNLVQLINFYENIVPCCVRICVGAEFQDLLFGKLWDTFSEDSVSRDVFVASLEPYILNDQVVEISPTITQCLLTHYEDKRNFEAAEACIVHLSISSLDIHQTLTLCWAHCLYDAIFYVYTRGMRDYITPLEELLTVLKNALDSDGFLSCSQVSLGNKILVYISCCLAGRAYPHGNIEKEEMKKVKHEVFKCITMLHTKNANNEEEKAFPFLRTLLRFDTREFLNVLSLAFEEEEFTSELGLIQRQRVVDILMQVMVDSEDFDQSQVCSLFIFIARQISKQSSASVSQQLISEVLKQLTCVESDAYHEERQSAFMELMHCKSFKGFDFDELTAMAEKARFYRVCEHIYEETGKFEKILECYLNDKFRRLQVFSYINSAMTSPHSHSLIKDTVKSQILIHVKSLIQLDSIELAKQLLNTPFLFPLIEQIAETLKNEELFLYDYLQALFASRSNFSSTTVSKRKGNNESRSEELSCDSILLPELQDAYIKLMCRLQPNQVYSYLQSAEGYRSDVVLEYCKEAELDDVTAFLLEKTGDLQGAFIIHLKILKQKITNLSSVCGIEDSSKLPVLFSQIQNQVMKIIKVSESGSVGADESGRRKLWFPLLDHLLELQTSIGNQNGLSADVRSTIGHIVNSMVPHISLPSILERIMHSPGYSDCSFGQIKHLLKDMVERYSYEETLFSTVIRVIQGDQLRYLKQMKTEAASPLPISSSSCYLCRSYYRLSSKALVFGCGHTYHEECGDDGSSCVVCAGPSSSRKEVKDYPIAQTSQSTELKMDETQIDGLKKVSVLDTNIPKLSMFENLKPLTSSSSNAPRQETFSQDFILKLAPKNIIPDVDDA